MLVIHALCGGTLRADRTTCALLGGVSLGVLLALGSNCAWAQTGPVLYVPNTTSNNVWTVDTSTSVVGSIATTSRSFFAAVKGDESLVYVSNYLDGTVTPINTATNTAGTPIQVGLNPYGIAMTPDGKTVYVANNSGGTVSVINTATNTVTATITGFSAPTDVVVTPDGKTAYVTDQTIGKVASINIATNTVGTSITVGTGPFFLTVSPDGKTVYVANSAAGTVSVINTTTNTVTATVTVGGTPVDVVVTPDGKTAYVANQSTVTPINTATNTAGAPISVGSGTAPFGLTVSPDGKTLYVDIANGGGSVATIDTTTNTVGPSLAASGGQFPAICSNGNALLAAGQTFKANASGALGCTGASGPVFTGGTMQFAGANIASSLPITLMSQGGTFDTAGNNATLSGAIGGSGGLTKIGAGTLTLSGAGSYAGPTNVSAGTLQAGAANVLSPNSAFAIASGAALDLNGFGQIIGGLSGTGAVVNSGGVTPTLTMANGATFAPGNGTPGSSMAIAANLAFQSGAIYLVQVNPSTASFATVSGGATLGGATVNAVFANGADFRKTYKILAASGGVSGTFGSVVNTNLPPGFKTTLSYDANDAFLNLSLAYASPGSGLNGNQQAVGNAFANFFNTSGGISLLLSTLAPNGLTQLSGETVTGSQQTTFDAMAQFMGLMTDPFTPRNGTTGPIPGATGYADESRASAYAANRKTDAFAMFTKAVPAAPFEPRWSVWAAGFGGSQATNGNTALGSNNTTSRIAGTAVGADYLISPNTIAGFALAGGGTSFSVANGGTGRSDLFQVGANVRHNDGRAYISAALAYGWQDITTDRSVAVAGLDQLRGEFSANAWSGRLEGGYRLVSPAALSIGITPYAAAQFVTFDLPAYAERAIAGTNNFALNYNAKDVTDARSELGFRTDKSIIMSGGILTLRGRFAWAHDYDPARSIAATFPSLPGASFVVNGAARAADSALTTASIEIKWKTGWSIASTFEGEFSSTTASYAGKGVVRYAW